MGSLGQISSQIPNLPQGPGAAPFPTQMESKANRNPSAQLHLTPTLSRAH